MKQKIVIVNTMENKVYLGLGTNLGTRKTNLQTAINEISKFATIIKKSSIYETDPIGYENQRKFLNMVIEIQTKLIPTKLLEKTQKTEKKMGRIKNILNGPRIIDIDILLYNQKKIKTKNLEIPHPRMHERKFVLEPFAEIAGEEKHPTLNRSIKELLKQYE